MIFGILSAMILQEFDFEMALQGILVAGAAVMGHQLLKQTKKMVRDIQRLSHINDPLRYY